MKVLNLTLLVYTTVVTAREHLTRSEIIDFIDCINSGTQSYNYTLSDIGQLLLQPYEIRELDHDGIDSHLTDCYINQSHNASFAMSGNIDYEPDLEDSVILTTNSVDTLIQWGWARMERITRSTINSIYTVSPVSTAIMNNADFTTNLSRRSCCGLYYGVYSLSRRYR